MEAKVDGDTWQPIPPIEPSKIVACTARFMHIPRYDTEISQPHAKSFVMLCLSCREDGACHHYHH